MACRECVPVDTTDPEGNYIRTDCRECGRSFDVEVLPEVSVESVDAPAPMTKRAMLAVMRKAVRLGIIEDGSDLEFRIEGASYAILEAEFNRVRIGFPAAAAE